MVLEHSDIPDSFSAHFYILSGTLMVLQCTVLYEYTIYPCISYVTDKERNSLKINFKHLFFSMEHTSTSSTDKNRDINWCPLGCIRFISFFHSITLSHTYYSFFLLQKFKVFVRIATVIITNIFSHITVRSVALSTAHVSIAIVIYKTYSPPSFPVKSVFCLTYERRVNLIIWF